MSKSEKEKMIAGELYRPGDPELCKLRERAQSLARDYNQTIIGESDLRTPLLDQLLGSYGSGCALRAPIQVDFGFNIHLGDEVFMNFGCVLLDVCEIRIGDKTQIGPNVQIIAADHPLDPVARDAGLENGKPVTIGRNVWIGASAVILPGVYIGDNAIIGAGAVVNRNVTAGTTVVGVPAKPLPPKT